MQSTILSVTFRSLCGVITAMLLLSAARGQDPAETPDAAVGVTPVGVQRFSPGGWSSIAVNGSNPADSDREVTVSVYLGDDPSLQFSKRFWLPAGGRRTTWLPILIPENTAVDQRRIQISSMQLKESERGEEYTKNAVGMPITTRSLMLTEQEINTAVMVGRYAIGDTAVSQTTIDEIYRTVHAGRDEVIESSLDLSLIDLSANFLAPTPRALDELDQIVIANDQILGDSAGLTQLREWLYDGGRVWIMLDHTGEEVVRALAGDATSHTVVDRVALNDFEIESADIIKSELTSEQWSSESPVEMVRVLADVDDISCRVDGWPAAFWQPFGRGEILFTTVAARGWLQDGRPTRAFHHLSSRFFDYRNTPANSVEPPLTSTEALTPILDHQIGYSIPSRIWAGSVLGINALVIFVAGCWWTRRRQLEKLAVLIPISAIASTAILMQVGNRQVKSVPSTMATGQIVRVFDSIDEAKVSTIRAIYSQDAAEVGLVSDYGTMTLPAVVEGSADTTRIRWDDSGRSLWQRTAQPPGVVRYAHSESTVTLSTPITARGTFDDQGFQARIQGLDSRRCEDGVIIAPPAPATATTIKRLGDAPPELTAASQSVLAPDQFVAGALLSHVQQMRQQVLRQILASPSQNPFGSDPSILVWTDPMSVGVEVDERFQRNGTALVCVPIRIDRPAAGTRYQIPATFVRVDTFAGSRGFSSVFDPRSRQWHAMSKPVETELVCRFPESLAPMQLNSVSLRLKINAPSRSLVVKAKIDGQPTEIFRQASPSGLVDVTIDRPEALQLNANGSWWMAIGITETEAERDRPEPSSDPDSTTRAVDQGDASSWQIDYVNVTAEATSP